MKAHGQRVTMRGKYGRRIRVPVITNLLHDERFTHPSVKIVLSERILKIVTAILRNVHLFKINVAHGVLVLNLNFRS